MELSTNAVLKSAYYRYSGILYCVFILLLYLFTKSYSVEVLDDGENAVFNFPDMIASQ